MSTVRALLYADARSLFNFAREVRRSPGRAIFWLMFVIGIVGFAVLRFTRHASPALFRPQITTDVLAGAGIMLLGNAIASGGRYAGLFANTAEARFIISSPSKPFVATAYVQVRELIKTSLRTSIGLFYAVLFYLPASLGPLAIGGDLLLVLCLLMVTAALPLPRALLRPQFAPLAIGAGIAIAVVGAAPIVRDFARGLPPGPWNTFVLRIPEWHPGTIMLRASAAQGITIACALMLTAALFALVARVANDAYPELYELSLNKIQRTERIRNRLSGRFANKAKAVSPVVSSGRERAPAGVLIFVWRAWTEYRRTTSPRFSAIEFVLFAAVGFAAGRISTQSDDAAEIILSIASTLGNLLFILALMISARISTELRRPLFWLSDATLFERLCGLAVGAGLRPILEFAALAAGLLAGNAPLAGTIGAVLLGPSGVLLAIAIGYASYGMIPFEADQRGPLMFFRLLAGYILLVPAIAGGIGAGMLAGNALAGVIGAGTAALLEAAVLIGFASWRLGRISVAPR